MSGIHKIVLIFGWLLAIFYISLIAYDYFQRQERLGAIDYTAQPYLKLKVLPEKIIGQIEYEPGLVGYGYITNEIPFEPYGDFIEIQSKRTGVKREYLKGYKKDGRPIYVAKVIPSVSNWQDPNTNKWYQYEKATTTKEAFELQTGKTLSAKSILFPIAFGASTSTYPIPGGYGDGALRVHTRTGFAAVHAETIADDAYNTNAYQVSGGFYIAANAWQEYRSHFFFNTNVGAGNTVSSSTFHTALQDTTICSNDSSIAIELNIYESASQNTTNITTEDYGKVKILNGDIVLSATATVAQLNASSDGNYHHFTGNSAMNTLIETNIASTTKLSIREAKYDATNNAPSPGADGYNVCSMYFSDQAGQSKDPYLEFEYSPPVAALSASIESDFLIFE